MKKPRITNTLSKFLVCAASKNYEKSKRADNIVCESNCNILYRPH